MFLYDYGKWVNLIGEDEDQWIQLEDLVALNLRRIKLVSEYSQGERQAKCWVTFGTNEEMINRSNFVVDKEEEVFTAVLEALKASRKLGGSGVSVGCLDKVENN